MIGLCGRIFHPSPHRCTITVSSMSCPASGWFWNSSPPSGIDALWPFTQVLWVYHSTPTLFGRAACQAALGQKVFFAQHRGIMTRMCGSLLLQGCVSGMHTLHSLFLLSLTVIPWFRLLISSSSLSIMCVTQRVCVWCESGVCGQVVGLHVSWEGTVYAVCVYAYIT